MKTLLGNPARENMLKSQILTGHVLSSPILNALIEVPRELFVPHSLQNTAYVDEEVPLENGRTLMEPLAFARLLEHAALKPNETVLDIGCTSGYSSAVISRIVQKVVAVEEDAALAARAKTLLATYPNIECIQTALTAGAPKSAPFDVILIEGAIETLPQPLMDQLREGGRLLTVEHEAHTMLAAAGLGKLVEYKKIRGGVYKTILRDANVTLLAAFKKPPMFTL